MGGDWVASGPVSRVSTPTGSQGAGWGGASRTDHCTLQVICRRIGFVFVVVVVVFCSFVCLYVFFLFLGNMTIQIEANERT